ncbi:MAG: hypothetical protein WC593_14090 [Methanoregula sp.]
MQLQEATPGMINAWKKTFDQYRTQLSPNKKTGYEIIAYIQQKYPITELNDEKIKQVVVDNVISNECHAKKLPAGKRPRAKGFFLDNKGAGKYLYENQDEVFRGMNIIIGVELETAFFVVEGSSLLWDELFAFRGLDRDDLTNFYLVAEYISCLKKSDLPDPGVTRMNGGTSQRS